MVVETDGFINESKHRILQDDKSAFSIFNLAPVVREEKLSQCPKLANVLNWLIEHLTDKELRQLNKEIEQERKDISTVAKAWLEKQRS